MASAAFDTAVRTPVGAATALTDEATTATTPGLVYQVTASTKRILDPNTNISVKVNGVTADRSTYSVDYLFGKIFFPVSQGANPVTVTGAYLTTQALAEATSVTLAMMGDILETTSFDSGGWKTRRQGLQDFSVDLEQLASLLYDQDPGAGTKRMWDLLASGTPFLVEIAFSGDPEVFRGWGCLSAPSAKVAVAALNTQTLKVVGAPFKGAGTPSLALASFGAP
jgi:hypothetical protein